MSLSTYYPAITLLRKARGKNLLLVVGTTIRPYRRVFSWIRGSLKPILATKCAKALPNYFHPG
jgi:hypothetical protein